MRSYTFRSANGEESTVRASNEMVARSRAMQDIWGDPIPCARSEMIIGEGGYVGFGLYLILVTRE